MTVIPAIFCWAALFGMLLSLLFAIVLLGYFFARATSFIFDLPLGFTPQLRKELKAVAYLGALVIATILLMIGSIVASAWLGIDIT